jgi:hypothetical protein
MELKATTASILLLGVVFVPAAAATHSSVDCSASGWGDESCSSTNACNYDERIGVHAYADDGQADKVHGEFHCGGVTASCTEHDGNCSDVPLDTAVSSGTGNCSGYIEDSSYDWSTFKLECFIWDSTSSTSQSGAAPVVSPLTGNAHDAYSGIVLETTAEGATTALSCEAGQCAPIPAQCVDLGTLVKCTTLQ